MKYCTRLLALICSSQKHAAFGRLIDVPNRATIEVPGCEPIVRCLTQKMFLQLYKYKVDATGMTSIAPRSSRFTVALVASPHPLSVPLSLPNTPNTESNQPNVAMAFYANAPASYSAFAPNGKSSILDHYPRRASQVASHSLSPAQFIPGQALTRDQMQYVKSVCNNVLRHFIRFLTFVASSV